MNSKIDQILLEPYYYLCQHPGKDIRSKLILAFDQWLPLEKSQREKITEIIEMLHTASLMVDDVEDGSNLRRSVPGTPSLLIPSGTQDLWHSEHNQ